MLLFIFVEIICILFRGERKCWWLKACLTRESSGGNIRKSLALKFLLLGFHSLGSSPLSKSRGEIIIRSPSTVSSIGVVPFQYFLVPFVDANYQFKSSKQRKKDLFKSNLRRKSPWEWSPRSENKGRIDQRLIYLSLLRGFRGQQAYRCKRKLRARHSFSTLSFFCEVQ